MKTYKLLCSVVIVITTGSLTTLHFFISTSDRTGPPSLNNFTADVRPFSFNTGGPKTSSPSSETNQQVRAKLFEAYGNLPLSFEANHGQMNSDVEFVSRGNGYSLFLTPTEAVFSLNKPLNTPTVSPAKAKLQAARNQSERPLAANRRAVVRLKFGNTNPTPLMEGQDQLPGKSNYFFGDNPQQWRTDVSNFAKVKYHEVYPGIDLIFYGNQRQLEYDFVVAPGADPHLIKLAIEGAQKLHVDAQGDLILQTEGGEIRQHKPVVYQEVDGTRREIAGNYIIGNSNEIGFQIGNHDPLKPLVIDPVLVYSTFLGGGMTDGGADITVDSEGNAYVIGATESPDFPTVDPIQPTVNNFFDVFIAKLNPSGSALVYSTFLGGNRGDRGHGIALDSFNNVYVTGITESPDFPVVKPLQPNYKGGVNDVFIAKLNSEGSDLVFSTYFGDIGYDYGTDVAVDSSGNAYVSGEGGYLIPTTPGAFKGAESGAFVLKLNSSGTSLIYFAIIGAGSANKIAVDGAGNAYVTGSTEDPKFPTTPNAFDRTCGTDGTCDLESTNRKSDAFVSKLNSAGSAPLYSTFLGGGDRDHGTGIAVDSFSNAYVTGYTYSGNFPKTSNAFQYPGVGAFVSKLNSGGTALNYSSLIGPGTAGDIALDDNRNAYVIGTTGAPDFPVVNPIQGSISGIEDAFVAKLNSTGTTLIFSTYLGGWGNELGQGIAVDSQGSAYVTGYTQSFDFPSYKSIQPYNHNDAFVAKIVDPSADLSISITDSPDPVTIGENLTYTIGVTNAGPSAVTEVNIADTLPEEVTFVSVTQTQGTCNSTGRVISCNLGALAEGATAKVRLVVKPTAVADIGNTVIVTGNHGGVSKNYGATAATSVLPSAFSSLNSAATSDQLSALQDNFSGPLLQAPSRPPQNPFPESTRNVNQLRTEWFNGVQVAAGEVLVKFRSVAAQSAAQIGRIVEAESLEPIGRGDIGLIRSRNMDVVSLIRELSAQPEVEYAEPNYIVHADAIPNDSAFNNLWGLRNSGQKIQGITGVPDADISATWAWDVSGGSRDNVIGVVDSGVDYNHPDLAANMWSAPTAFTVVIGGQTIRCEAGTHGFDAITKTCDPMDDDGHGTHVAGTVGAVGNNGIGVAGVNWTASMMGLKFLGAQGRGTTADAINAIEFAIQAKKYFAATKGANVRILNNSWGGTEFSRALLDQVNRANTSDMLFVAAAGNNSSNNEYVARYPANYNAPNVVTVAATDNRDALASFSNYGKTRVHLGAPGVGVYSAINGGSYAYLSGTSMAAPHVAGAAALALARCALSTSNLKSTLLNNVDPVPSLSATTATGGRLNVNKAVRACSPTFAVSATPQSQTVRPGGKSNYSIAVHSSAGFAGDVVFGVSGLPGGATASFSPSSVYKSGSTTMTVSVSGSTSSGSYPLTVTATSGGKKRTVSVSLTVTSLSVVNLGTIGGSNSLANGINTYSQVVGTAHDVSGNTRAFLHDGNLMTKLGTLGGVYSSAYGISDSGQAVGAAFNAANQARAFLYSGTMADLGTLGGRTSYAHGVNNAGQVVGYSRIANGDVHAFLYSGGVMTDLGTLGGRFSKALSVNDSGQVAGYSTTAQGETHAFIYDGATKKKRDLGTLPGGTYSEARGINDLGHVVGYSFIKGSSYRAFVFKNDVMVDLGTLPGGNTSVANAVNNAGQMVGYATVAGGDVRAFLYQEGGVLTDLNSLIPANSGWILKEATNLNDAGEVVGWGMYNGQIRAFLLKLSTSNTNSAPAVTLTNPGPNAQFIAPASVLVSANAADSDGTISKVSFYANGALIGTDSTGPAPYTFTWTNVPAGSYALTAVATDDAGASSTSSEVSITVSAPANGGALPAPWSSKDIGRAGAAGGDSYEGGVFTLRAAGADIYGRADSFHYVYQALSGDGQIVARVAGISKADDYSVAGVMIRESLAANSRHATVLALPGGKTKFRYRVGAGGETTSIGIGVATTLPLPQWVKLVRKGDAFTGYRSADGISWQASSAATVPMGTNVLVGLATASHHASILSTSTLDHVWTGAAGGGVRVLPAQADAYVQDGTSSGQRFGTAADLKVKRYSGTGYNRHAYLKFDLGTVPGNISSARLRLYGQLTSATSSNVPAALYSVGAAGWNESQITWDNKPAAGSAILSSTIITDTVGRWYEFDLTQFVQAERAAGRQIISVVLKGTQTSDAYPQFRSREAADRQPELFVATAGDGGFGARINFQPAAAPVPAGHLADTGAAFGDRGNGYSYGWNADAGAQTRDRNASNSPDQRYDTLIFTQKYGAYFWEMAVPNGTYLVRIVSGDPSYYGFRYRTEVEGVTVVSGTSTSAAPWVEGTRSVTVSDGRLTVRNGSGATNNKLCFIEISSP